MIAAPEQRLLTRAFVLAWLSHFLHCVASSAYVHLPGFLKSLGASELSIGSLYGATAAIAVVSRPSLGSLMDRHGRRVFILGAGGLHVILCASYVAIGDLSAAIYVLRALHGVIEAVIFSILFTYAADIVPPSRRTEGIALFGISSQLPIAVGALAGDAILAHGSYHALFAVTAAFAAAGFAVSLPLREPDHAPVSVPSRGLLACATQRDLLPLWFVGVVFGTAVIPMFAFVKTYVMVTHLGSVSSFLVAYSLTATALRFFLGRLPAYFGQKRTLGAAMLCVGAGLLLLARATSDTQVVVAGVFAGAGHGFAFPIVFGLVVDRARSAERAVAVSLVTSLFDVGQLIGGPLFGTIIDGWGHPASFTAAAAVAILGFAAFAAWDRMILSAVPRGSG